MRLNQPLPPNIPTRSVIIAGVFYLFVIVGLYHGQDVLAVLRTGIEWG